MTRLLIASAFMALLCTGADAAVYKTNFNQRQHTKIHTQTPKPVYKAKKRVVSNPGAVEAMVRRTAAIVGVPVELAVKIAHHESRFQCSAVGAAGERGVMQIKPSTARGIGYKGPTAALNDCQTGITWGMKYLKMAVVAAKGNIKLAAYKYNAGLGARSRNHQKKRYVQAVTG